MTLDMALQHRALQELEWEPGVDSAHIGVIADNGVVSLTGEVVSYVQKLAAERAVKRISGVRGLVNGLAVALNLEARRSDDGIARAAVQALDWNSVVPKERIRVTVTHGHVRLEGIVPQYHQRAAAEAAISHLTGVKSVSNMITLKPAVTADDVKARIVAAFERHADIDAGNVVVETTGSTVALSGQVRSWAERRAAEDAAWAAPGVVFVRDDITVAV